VTDANVAVGKIQPAFFPRVFGPRGDEALDGDVVARASPRSPARSSARPDSDASPGAVAEGFIDIAVGAWPTRSRRSRSRAATTSPATRCSASAAPAASTPAASPTRSA
jgi:N-methylhydantoinase A/oxoprolinase/acetone carboxylase beta subunit